jgi:tetratricopeptide (TPR) repeat protein
MKKLAIILLTLSIHNGWAQKLYKKDLLQIEKNVYNNAVKNYDINAAKNSVYRIIELEGAESTYLDTLAFIYFNEKSYLSCLKVSERILKKEEKLPILELKAISLENLQAYKDAINVYEKIYAQKKEPYIAYKLASLQQKIKRSAEAYATLKSAEKLTFPEKAFITFPGAKKNEIQNVPFKAAFYDLLAMTSYDLHNYEMASKYFDEALKIYPDFYVAKQNKQAIDLMMKKLQTNDKQPANSPGANPKK